MARSRVVRPDTKTLHISDGDWLLVKKRLNHGEQQEAFARRYTPTGALNLKSLETVKVSAFLLDWSLMGLDEKPLVIRDKPIDVVESLLNSLDPADVREIVTAINQHELDMAAERDAEKNGKDGETSAPAISPSPSGVAGELIGSAT